MPCSAGVAHPVERHLAKVEVASSSLVTRSIKRKQMLFASAFFLFCSGEARIIWMQQSGGLLLATARRSETSIFSCFGKRKCNRASSPAKQTEPRHPQSKPSLVTHKEDKARIRMYDYFSLIFLRYLAGEKPKRCRKRREK